MSCNAEQVTGYVDGALDAGARAEVEAHLAGCATCREQAEFEQALRERLRALPAPEPRPGFDHELRRRLRRSPVAPLRWLLPLAAGLAGLALWARGAAPIVAWELARDHAHCFGMARLPAQVLSSDPERVALWFEERRTRLPELPVAAGGLELVGGRFCSLPDGSRVAHVYYVGDKRRQLSLFVLPRRIRDGAYTGTARRHFVRLTRVGDATVGLVSGRLEDVEAMKTALTTAVAWDLAAPAP